MGLTARGRYFFIVLFGLCCFSYFSSVILQFSHVDEGFWILVSKHAFSSELYTGFFDHKPPFLFQLTWLLSGGGSSIFLLHLSKILIGAISAFLLKEILRFYQCTEETARRAALIFALTSGLTVLGAYSQERMIVFFCLITHFLFLHPRPLYYFLGGLAAGAAVGIKQTSLILLAPTLVHLLLSRRPWLSISIGALSAIFFTLLSWLATGVELRVIWQEGYLANFRYVAFDSFGTTEGKLLVLQDVCLIFLAVLPGLVLLPLYCFLQKPKSFFYPFDRKKLELIVWILSSLASVALGKRFFQQYFFILVPLLSALTALAVTRFQSPQKSFRWVFLLNVTIVGIWMVYALTIQALDKNKHRDSLTEQLVHEIKTDSEPTDKIWISNSLHSVYFRADRTPAVRYLYFHWMVDFIDVCRVPEDQIRESIESPEYRETMEKLRADPPKIIFWTQRESNSCSNRLKIEKFPQIENLLKEKYDLKWQSALGMYFLRRD